MDAETIAKKAVECQLAAIERRERIEALKLELGADDCESDSSEDSVKTRRVLRKLLRRKQDREDAIREAEEKIRSEQEMRHRMLLWENPTLFVRIEMEKRRRARPPRPAMERHAMPAVSCCVQPNVAIQPVDTLRPLFTFCPSVPFPARFPARFPVRSAATKRKRAPM
jgi:hypothetical protein